ncbi:MAG: amidohydrolase [Oscillospiraceae bacterium]|nr:amidohydrolase [Oscillospiraceae bacterium]MDD4368365.1 amidohydrolase [Oscillospiraceae bacterium]
MNIRFYHARLMPLAADSRIIDGELWTEDRRISFVGTSAQAIQRQTPAFDREIDLQGDLLLPGFKDAHTHSPMTFLRSFADDLPLLDWLNKQVFPLEAKLDEEAVYWFTRLAILEYLSSGITANYDMYMFPAQIAQAAMDSGFRTVLCGALNDFSGSVAELAHNYQYFNQLDDLISYRLGFHAEYTCSPDLLRALSSLLHELKSAVSMHSSETRSEVEACIARTGLTPTAWMDSLGLLDFGGCAFHCVHLTQEDIAIMKQRHLAVVSNPGSNTKLASGIAPLVDLQEQGLKIALGTDGPASNNCLDMFREMFLATGLQKLLRQDAAALPADQVLLMATRNGAEVMGLESCRYLAAGQQADLVRIDLQQPNMQPLNNIAKNLVYAGSKSNVRMTMVSGRILFEDGNYYVGEPVETIYRQAQAAATRIQNS